MSFSRLQLPRGFTLPHLLNPAKRTLQAVLFSCVKKVIDDCKWRIKETIKYVGSAYSETPKPLLELCKLKRKKFVFYCVDRFSRNYLAGFDLASKFLKNKNELYFIIEKLKVTKDSGDEWETFCKYLKYAEAESQDRQTCR